MNNKLKLFMLSLCLTICHGSNSLTASQYNDTYQNNNDIFNSRINTLDSLSQRVNQMWKNDTKIKDTSISNVLMFLSGFENALKDCHDENLDPRKDYKMWLGNTLITDCIAYYIECITRKIKKMFEDKEISQDEYSYWEKSLYSISQGSSNNLNAEDNNNSKHLVEIEPYYLDEEDNVNNMMYPNNNAMQNNNMYQNNVMSEDNIVNDVFNRRIQIVKNLQYIARNTWLSKYEDRNCVFMTNMLDQLLNVLKKCINTEGVNPTGAINSPVNKMIDHINNMYKSKQLSLQEYNTWTYQLTSMRISKQESDILANRVA